MNVETIEEGKPSYENIDRGVEIYIEANPDHYRGGFAWSVCRDESELDCGLALTEDEAMAEAQRAIATLDFSLA